MGTRLATSEGSPKPLNPNAGVAMGTRLATSEESPLAAPTKTAIVNSREDETIYRSF